MRPSPSTWPAWSPTASRSQLSANAPSWPQSPSPVSPNLFSPRRGDHVVSTEPPACTLCGSFAARQAEPPADLGDPEVAAMAALEELKRQVEAGEQSLSESPRPQGL